MYGLITKLAVLVAGAIYVIYSVRAATPDQAAAGLTSGVLATLTTVSHARVVSRHGAGGC